MRRVNKATTEGKKDGSKHFDGKNNNNNDDNDNGNDINETKHRRSNVCCNPWRRQLMRFPSFLNRKQRILILLATTLIALMIYDGRILSRNNQEIITTSKKYVKQRKMTQRHTTTTTRNDKNIPPKNKIQPKHQTDNHTKEKERLWYGHHHPRYIHLYRSTSPKIKTKTRRDLNNKYNMYNPTKQQALSNDMKYDTIDTSQKTTRYTKANPYLNHTECQPMYKWQSSTFCTCNIVHEIDLKKEIMRNKKFIQHGYFRDTHVIHDTIYTNTKQKLLFKTLRYFIENTEHMIDKHRMDAISHERLSFSPHVIDIYAYCGNGALYEYGSGGTLHDEMVIANYNRSKLKGPEYYLKRLKIAVQVAKGVKDLHGFNRYVDIDYDVNGNDSTTATNDKKKKRRVMPPAIVHADIMLNQFVRMEKNGSVYKLNDFNRAHFMYWNTTISATKKELENDEGGEETNNIESCPYYYDGYNAWIYRSPEEYSYTQQTEKIDIYSMGNIFYALLTNNFPFGGLFQKHGEEYVQELIRNGKRPKVRKPPLQSTDPSIQVLITAKNMCWKQDWRERASAMEVEEFLVESLDSILKERKRN